MIYRAYYNRSADWPQCWSVDEGDQSTEINVTGISTSGCPVTTRELPAPARGTEGAAAVFPTAWIEIQGRLSIERGRAVFSPECPTTP